MFQAAFKKFMPTLGAVKTGFKMDGLIHFIEARRGRGKSYTLSRLVKHCVKHKIPVRTNSQSIDFYKVAFQCTSEGTFTSLLEALEWVDDNVIFVSHWDHLLTAHDCMVILDEVTRLFEGRAGFAAQKTPQIMYDWVQQSRKVRVTIYMAGQSFGWIDKKIAELVDVHWQVRKVEGKGKKFRNPDGTQRPAHFYLYGRDPRGAGETHSIDRTQAEFVMNFPFEFAVAELYNSWELINLVTGDPSYRMIQDLKAHFKREGVIWEPDAKEVLRNHLERIRNAGSDPYDRWLESSAEAGGGAGVRGLPRASVPLSPQHLEAATVQQENTPVTWGSRPWLAWDAPKVAD